MRSQPELRLKGDDCSDLKMRLILSLFMRHYAEESNRISAGRKFLEIIGFNFFAFAATDHGKILVALFVALLAAKLMAEAFERIHQPAVVGEIIAGIIIGPAVLNWVQPTDVLEG